MTNEIVTIIFTGVVAVATIVYVYLTSRLVKETKLSREFHLESYILAYIVNSETSPSIVSLIIKNIGNGVARNVRFEILKDINYKDCSPLSSLGIFINGLDFFPPGHEYKYILMSLENNSEKMKDRIEFNIEYSDAIKKNRKQHFSIAFKEIEGIGKLTPPETYIGMISYRLEKIEKILEKKLK